MKIFVSADIEGITGITAPEEANPDHKDIAYFREQMTREVRAACEGAIAAGATEILVKDAHWTGRNIDPRALPESTRIVRGWTGHPYSMMAELSREHAAVLYVGYHARAGSGGNPLAHTLSGRTVAMMRLNDRPASEFLLNTLTATSEDVPVAFLSGDAALCDEVKDYNESIRTVATFRGIGDGTVSIHPALAERTIKTAVEDAVGHLAEIKLRPLPARFKLEIDYRSARECYRRSFYPGARIAGDGTIVFESGEWFEVLRALHFLIG